MSASSGSSSSSPTKPAARSPRARLFPSTSTSSAGPLQLPSSAYPQPLPLHLTIRFSNSLPDLHLEILNPNDTTVVRLKHLIRGRLSQDKHKKKPKDDIANLGRRRLRFIHSGKILPDPAALSSVLKAPPPPPLSAGAKVDPRGNGNWQGKGKGKGKDVVQQQQRVYVNCSIGDELSEKELEDEARLAQQPASTDTNTSRLNTYTASTNTHTQTQARNRQEGGGGRRTPRGFDRLLEAGFTPAEVNQLRLQFRSIHESRYTRDTMPSPDSFRRMEDGWIDNNHGGGGGGGGGEDVTGGGGEGGAIGGDTNEDLFGFNAVIDTLIKGMFVGFIFPLGAFGWLLREEHMFSRRWQVFIGLGFILSLAIGIVRILTVDQ
ncbi:DUF2407 C-terminal domain-containing protein [Diplogelasinospora grovesii]|uniref:DUF2407 C-terminal domain-containing protein n=1 Tax=Diplogelasinospora grovesii TaxID=303347 RepID=A0AAN6N9P1_9PEZI|nr:DUF2407 C-terminal domain-containing protein [Diplogelasinospora grovesii]